MCTLLDIVCAGGAQAYFSLMLPTCVHFRKMEQFSTLREKVQVLETWTATLMYQYDSVSKTALDSEKHHVGGRELALVFFRRAFSEEKRNDRVILARFSHDIDVFFCF